LKKQVDNLIVGGGLAGIWLAFQLMKTGRSFALIDKPGLSISSSVAAGIFNPILPGRQKQSYNSGQIYPGLGKKYHEMETLIGQKVLSTPHICYILEDQKSLNDWSVLAASEPFKGYIEIYDKPLSKDIQSDFGYLEVTHSGRVDIPKMIHAFKTCITSPNILSEEIFDEERIELNTGGVTYGDINARHLILCQGAALSGNKLTSNLPLKPAKGEILLVRTQDYNREDIIPQNGVFMLPLGDHLYKVGSNFEWEDLSYATTKKAKEEILRKFTRWFKGDFEVVGQEAGLRPSSEDRRPLIGRIDPSKPIFIFNGLGSKGVALAPTYSEMLLKYIYDEEPIDKEVDVQRLKMFRNR
jgi:glycine oxidase